MPGNIFAVNKMSSLLPRVGINTPFQSQINREGIGFVDVTGGYRKQSYTRGSSYILMMVICVSGSSSLLLTSSYISLFRATLMRSMFFSSQLPNYLCS